MSTFSRSFNHHWKCRKQERFSDNLGHNICEHYNVLQVRLSQVKRSLISIITNLVYELPRQLSRELPNDLRLKILGN